MQVVKCNLNYIRITLVLTLLFFSVAHASNGKILYHLHNTDQNSYRRAISNLENLQKGMPEQQLDIIILLQGNSIMLLNFSEHNRKLNQRFLTLLNNGVSIEVSRENFQMHHHFFDDIGPPGQVPNIFERIIELQKQGYHYITP